MHRFALVLPVTLALHWLCPRPSGRSSAGRRRTATPRAKLPTEWDTKKNVTWRKELPGEGWSSPVVAAG